MNNKLRSRITEFITIYVFLATLCALFPSDSFAQSPSLKFDPETVTISNGSTFDVKVIIDTAGKSAGGAGAKIEFDPGVVSVVSIEPGSIFADYPTVFYDNTGGRITISGIVASPSNLYKGSGTFATIKFRGISVDTAELKFDFKKGSTTDSNIAVTYAPGDILAEVNTLDLTVEEGVPGAVIQESPTAIPAPSEAQNNKKEGIVDKIKRFLGLTEDKNNKTDPYAPIISQAPNSFRVPYTNRPLPQTIFTKYGILPFLILIFILLVFIGILLHIYLKKRKQNAPPSAHVVNKDI